MPVPKPEPGESERDFISRCISALHKTDPERPDDQITAMCYTTWRKREQVGPATPGADASPDRRGTTPTQCVCRQCNYVLDNPGAHCVDIECPSCGASRMYRKSGPEGVEWLVPFETRRFIK